MIYSDGGSLIKFGVVRLLFSTNEQSPDLTCIVSHGIISYSKGHKCVRHHPRAWRDEVNVSLKFE